VLGAASPAARWRAARVAPCALHRALLQVQHKHAVVVGAGIAGLAAAQQLQMFGFRVSTRSHARAHAHAHARAHGGQVTVLEGRDRIGGRIFTSATQHGDQRVAIDLGTRIGCRGPRVRSSDVVCACGAAPLRW
jgi:NADPH-dependent 2,4-dienoyl-CoA reductase/sulfur reductase-like enzyme